MFLCGIDLYDDKDSCLIDKGMIQKCKVLTDSIAAIALSTMRFNNGSSRLITQVVPDC